MKQSRSSKNHGENADSSADAGHRRVTRRRLLLAGLALLAGIIQFPIIRGVMRSARRRSCEFVVELPKPRGRHWGHDFDASACELARPIKVWVNDVGHGMLIVQVQFHSIGQISSSRRIQCIVEVLDLADGLVGHDQVELGDERLRERKMVSNGTLPAMQDPNSAVCPSFQIEIGKTEPMRVRIRFTQVS